MVKNGLVSGRVGIVDAALVRWLRFQKTQLDHLAIHITQSLFEPALPCRHLEELLCALEFVDAVLPSSNQLPGNRQQEQGSKGPKIISLPEDDLLHYSLERICKKSALVETEACSTKLATLQRLISRFGARPPRSETVGIVSGAFDLFHPGHLALIKAAKSRVDHLIILTMSSDSIRRQEKNRLGDRPIYSMSERVDVLAALRPVEHVVVFDDLDCLPSLQEFCPDYFFKNVKDRSRPVVRAEANLVERLGGQTVYLENPQRNYSSTAMIEYIRQQAGIYYAKRFALP